MEPIRVSIRLFGDVRSTTPSGRTTGAGVTEVQDDGRFPESGETGPRSAVRPGTAALFAAQVP
ncbi:predicted protein [Streptomyces viridosporus ATCC 14672]|uniref:Predicted protein n=1 Tax=Streptomyces viridosporus (strain ATCC 14672 / DSM 40746 / JCM 4963 / KCTC 9882 / NRRL B-12104 / FH 1290) TaxID=566461 RepID=D5ZRD3_STRV1|nr:predicted protein [Streptomyces viridosporus ATCC 14672]